MKCTSLSFILLVVFYFLGTQINLAQLTKKEIDIAVKRASFLDLRGSNSLDVGVGTAVPNNDFENPIFEIYFKVGYKRYVSPHLFFAIDYHKFNLANTNAANNGFMSFDANINVLLLPYQSFSPYLFFGAGYMASNYFEETNQKLQIGLGVEYMVIEKVGVTLFADYNHMLDDNLDGLVAGDSNDTFFRIGLGLHFYFGGAKKQAKILKNVPTVIKSNPIIIR